MNAMLNTYPLAAMRPAENHRGRPRSPERVAVEAVLLAATNDDPVSVATVAARCGLSVIVTRTHINNAIYKGVAHNTRPGVIPAVYAGGPAVAAPQTITRHAKPGDYDGRELRPYQGRPGAMDAFALPSLQNGQRVPHRPPRSSP